MNLISFVFLDAIIRMPLGDQAILALSQSSDFLGNDHGL